MVDAKYIWNGELSLYDIAADVKNRKLTVADINRLSEEPLIQKDFFGDLEPLKRPRAGWNSEYLDDLSMATALQCFNHEYLLYLAEVADYVYKTKKRKRLALGLALASVAIAAVIAVLAAFGLWG